MKRAVVAGLLAGLGIALGALLACVGLSAYLYEGDGLEGIAVIFWVLLAAPVVGLIFGFLRGLNWLNRPKLQFNLKTASAFIVGCSMASAILWVIIVTVLAGIATLKADSALRAILLFVGVYGGILGFAFSFCFVISDFLTRAVKHFLTRA